MLGPARRHCVRRQRHSQRKQSGLRTSRYGHCSFLVYGMARWGGSQGLQPSSRVPSTQQHMQPDLVKIRLDDCQSVFPMPSKAASARRIAFSDGYRCSHWPRQLPIHLAPSRWHRSGSRATSALGARRRRCRRAEAAPAVNDASSLQTARSLLLPTCLCLCRCLSGAGDRQMLH